MLRSRMHAIIQGEGVTLATSKDVAVEPCYDQASKRPAHVCWGAVQQQHVEDAHPHAPDPSADLQSPTQTPYACPGPPIPIPHPHL